MRLLALFALGLAGCSTVVGADFEDLHRRCDNGRVDCDDDTATGASGCEVDVQRDRDNCGACGNHCANACVEGRCADCPNGFADCDGDFSTGENGCESELASDAEHCGECGHGCEPDSSGATVCDGGECVPACDGGYSDCNGEATDGCEAPLRTDVENCGECGVACKNAHGTTTCDDGECLPACDDGFEDCDRNAANGCEAELESDTRNCGACGERCLTGGVCMKGQCDCPPVRPDVCGSSCVALESDPAHCGDCETDCGTPASTDVSCLASSCRYACNDGTVECGSIALDGCVDLERDEAHCGDCDTQCSAGLACLGGACCEPIAIEAECNPFPVCGCAGDSVCVPDTEDTGLVCTPSGSLELGDTCSTGDCTEGMGCFGAACKAHCQVDADCAPVDGIGRCFQTIWSSSGNDITGVKVCAMICDPVTPQAPRFGLRQCGEGLSCDPTDDGASDCSPAGQVPIGGACSVDDSCVPGAYCSVSGSCRQFCFTTQDCLVGECKQFTTPQYAGSRLVGYCN